MQPSAVTALRTSLRISETWVSLLFESNRIAFYDPLLQRLSTSIPLCADAVEVLGAMGSQVFTISVPSSEPFGSSSSELPIGCGIIQCFDAASMQSQSEPFPLLSPEQMFITGFSAAAIDGYLYIVGGSDFSSYDMPTAYKVAARLDVKTKTWEAMPDMHIWREAAQAVVLQGRLHVIGGCTDDSDVYSGEIWDPRSQEWMLEPQLWAMQIFGRDELPPKVAVVLDVLYAVKEDEEHVEHWKLMQYVNASKLWISLGSFSIDRYACRCGPVEIRQLVGVGEELWVIINCSQIVGTCTAHILSCVPSTGFIPPRWRSLAIRTSDEFLPGHVVVAGIVHV